MASSDRDGWALFSTSLARRAAAGTYTVTVTGVSASGANYVPSTNTKTSTTFTVK